MKQSRKIRRSWLREIPQWMRCFCRSVMKAAKSQSGKAAKAVRAVGEKCSAMAHAVNAGLRTQNAKLCAALKSHTKEWAAAALAAGLIISPYMAEAAPQGGVVVGGEATIAQNGAVTNIAQASQRAAIDWASFDIAKHETVNFQQPNASAVALNRIVGNNSSAIYGQLNANGIVYLANPNGMYFAPGAQVNVAGLIATTSHVDPLAFMQNGTINTGERNAAINMQGSIFASGGLVEIKGATAINVGGIIQATTLNGNGGNITISNTDNLNLTGGTLRARGSGATGNGGFIETSGDVIAGLDNVLVNAGSDNGVAGTWLIDPQNYNIGGGAGVSDMSGVELGNNLNTQNMIILSQSGANAGLGDVNVLDPVNWTADNSLTLSAYHDVNVLAPITNSAATSANITLQADNTGIGYTTGATAATGGTVNLAMPVTLSGTGYVKIYYNPTDYTAPTPYAPLVLGNSVAYMLVNQLGNEVPVAGEHSLAAISNNPGLWDKNYALGRDIDAAATTGWNVNAGVTAGFLPIGNGMPFVGKFDGGVNLSGGNYTLSNLYINSSAQYVGLFGFVGNSATISNLVLNNPTITNNYNSGAAYIGSVAGYNDGGTIAGITINNGTISATSANSDIFLGGVIGKNTGVVNNVTATAATITGSSVSGWWEKLYVGGIAGLNAGTISSAVLSTITVSASNPAAASILVGGAAGGNEGGTIDGITISNGMITGSNAINGGTDVGGLIGLNNSGGIINNSYITGGTITGGGSGSNCYVAVGGGIGTNAGGTITGVTITNAAITGYNSNGPFGVNVGGVVGYYPSGTIIASTITSGVISASSLNNVANVGDIFGGGGGINNLHGCLRNGTITLHPAGNTVLMTGTSASIIQTVGTALTIGLSSVSAGGLTVTATGAVTQSGALNVSGTTTINAGTNAITLADTGNDFDALSLT
ncbi:MAG: filamentous hemagglutinin N-terminal domain-containing protein, partial [Negativicutes bacterium]